MSLKDKRLVVTGASRGIGLACARHFASAGAQLILVARQKGPLQETADALDARWVAGDVGDPDTWQRVSALTESSWPSVDGLFFNAGYAPFVPLEEVEAGVLIDCMRVHVLGSLLGIQALLPQLTNPSAVLLTGSGMHHRPLAQASIWAASTHAVRGLGRALAVELAPRGIRVNVLSHGPVDTPIFDSYGMPKEAVAAMKKNLAQGTLLGRLARAEEIAEIAALLVDTGFTTGTEVLSDGGWSIAGAAE
ncbi:MAG: SDR family oxidoreductase [Myxococcota bacterium]